MSLRERPSNVWFDEECRAEKIRVHSLEKRVRATGDPVDHSAWVDNVKSMHRLFSAKKAASTVGLIKAESGDLKRLWRVLNATMGLSEAVPDIPHSAEDFTRFFADKVSRIRALTVDAPLPVYSTAVPSCSLLSFEPVTVESTAQLVMKAPCKHSQLDPLPTWLLKQCVMLLAPFLTRLIIISIQCGSVSLRSRILTRLTLTTSDLCQICLFFQRYWRVLLAIN